MARSMPAPVPATRPMSTPLTVAAVPTGMNNGVGTGPWGVWSTPARARPLVASMRRVTAAVTVTRQLSAARGAVTGCLPIDR